MEITLGQVVSALLQVALLIASGAVTLVLKGAGRKIEDLAAAVRDMARDLQAQALALARGDQRFADHERRLGELEEQLRELARERERPRAPRAVVDGAG